MATCKTRREASGETRPYRYLHLGLLASRSVRKQISVLFFFKFFLDVDPFFEVFIEFVTVLLLVFWFLFLMFWFFDRKACEILAPQLGIKPVPSCIGKQSLNHCTTR